MKQTEATHKLTEQEQLILSAFRKASDTDKARLIERIVHSMLAEASTNEVNKAITESMQLI